jgi:ribonuclease HI
MSKPQVTIYSDGGCRPNPGTGGWGAVLLFKDGQKELSGGARESTNNQMELTAVITALDSLEQPYQVDLYTDSKYVKQGITEWMAGWVRKGWRTSSGKPVQNQELWEKLYAATQRHDIRWKWVKGHAGHVYNERVDQLATAEIERLTGKTFARPTPETVTESDAAVKIYVGAVYSYEDKAGGWGAVVVSTDGAQELSGSERNSTDNQLILTASIAALDSLKAATSAAVYTDSEYLQKGMSQWIKGWMKKDWKTSSGQPVKNRELWERLQKAAQQHEMSWIFSGVSSNEHLQRAFELANRPLR